MKKQLFWSLVASILVLSQTIVCAPVPKPTADGTLDSKLEFIRYLAKGSWAEILRGLNAEEKFDKTGKESRPNAYSRDDASWQIISSMPLLKVLGLEEEFAKAKAWLTSGALVVNNATIYVADLAENSIGGLLSCYAQTGDRLFLDKSVQVAKMLEQYYDLQTGIARNAEHNTNPVQNQTVQNQNWFTGQQLENAYLSNLTGNALYSNRNSALRAFLNSQLDKPNGLYMDGYDFANANARASNISSLEQHYNLLLSLVQSYVQSQDVGALQMYVDLMDAVQKNGLISKSKNGWTFVRTLNNSDGSYGNQMDVTECAMGAVLSQGAQALKHAGSQVAGTEESRLARIALHQEWARNLTETCRQATLLGQDRKGFTPIRFSFTDVDEFKTVYGAPYQFYTLPRSYYVLSRLTDQTDKYRNYAWEMVETIYGDLVKVSPNGETTFELKPFRFMGTLQYLYLTLSNRNVFPVDQWVFTFDNHALPVLK